MNVAKLVGGGLLAYALAVGCGGMSSRAGGSNTNWFETCNSTAECGSGLECWCGVCTSTCATDCGAHAGAMCTKPPVTCTDETKSACAIRCQKDADCSALGSSTSCVDSICRKGAAAGGDGGTLTCNERVTAIGTRIGALEAMVDRSCTTTADCVDFPDARCHAGCGALASKAGAAAVAAEVAAVEKELCDPFDAAGCFYPIPPCFFPGTPACVAGQCRYVLPGAPVDSGTASCDFIGNQIVDRLTAATDVADDRCTKDADCTHAGPGASCLPDCPYKAVSKAGAASIAAERAAVERDLCPQLDTHGCSPLIYTCTAAPVWSGYCDTGMGRCHGAPATLIDGGFTCADRTAEFRQLLEGTARKDDKNCSHDDDCTVTMLANRCYESCTYAPTSQLGAARLRQTLMQEEGACSAFEEAGCTVTRLPCVAPPVATCQAGQCALPQ